MRLNRIAVLALLLSIVALPCLAGVSPEEAAKLKTTLTPLGGERAGNKEGTIPEWTGKYPPAPAGKITHYPGDLFPDEKPLFSITSKNMDQYADKLTEGAKAWLKRHPEWRLDVYPTHRTGVAPEYVYEGTFKNATNTKLNPDGWGFRGAINGIPFPIPKSGVELIWNQKLTFKGSASYMSNRSYIVPDGGKPVLVGERISFTEYAWYQAGMTEEKFQKVWSRNISAHSTTMTAPPASAGEITLSLEPSDYSIQNDPIRYQYVVGQRRVRRTPSLNYDSPNPVTSGYNNSDESTLFYGKPDKYNWKLLGKKELYIPYNNNRLYGGGTAKDADIIAAGFLNPDRVRWELHRVWILEATLIPGKRHVMPRRVIYLDEDTWLGVATDTYDSAGRLWKIGFDYLLFDPRVPAIQPGAETYFNMQTGGMLVDSFTSTETGRPVKILNGGSFNPPTYYTPDALAARGLR